MDRLVRAVGPCAWAFVALLGLFAGKANADLFYLTEDRLIEGILVREDTSTVTFKLEGAGLWTLSRHSLHKMERESPGDYWMRIGDRQTKRKRLDKARDSFEKAQREPDTRIEAEGRLKEIDLLEGIGGATPPEAPEPVVSDPVASAPASLPQPVSKAPQVASKKSTQSPSGMEKRLSGVIRTHSQKNGVDPLLVKAIISVESGWNPSAESSSGARGLMQLMPDTARQLGVKNSFDPVENIRGGVNYFGQMLREFTHLSWRERVTQALASYHAGLGKIREVGDYRKIPKTRRYIDKVMKAYDEIRNRKDSEFAFLGRERSF